MPRDLSQHSKDELLVLLERRDAEINALIAINQRMKEHFRLESLLREIMNFSRQILRSESCSLLLMTEDQQELYFYVTDDRGLNLSEITIKTGQGIVGRVVESQTSIIVNDTSTDPRFFAGVDAQTGFRTRSLICVPMSVEGRVIGAVEVLNRLENQLYTEEDQRLLEYVASQSALAIEYVRSNEKRSLSERMAVVGNMAASIIHDLRNSMQVISGFSQLIAMQQPGQKENCEVIRSEIDKLVILCQELLEFSRGSRISLELRAVSLRQVLQMVFELNQSSMRDAGVEFRFEFDQDCSVQLDLIKIQRALQNLLQNARESLTQQGMVSLEGGLDHRGACIRVRDSGKGMDQATIKRLFEPFFTKGKASGTGLGMAIVQHIIKGHGATIEVLSTLGEGTCIEMIFPVSQ